MLSSPSPGGDPPPDNEHQAQELIYDAWETPDRQCRIAMAKFVGLPVLRTRTSEQTVKTMSYVALQGRAVAWGALPRRGRRPRGKTALQRHILQGLPSVGPERAARLIERFGSVRSVMAAEELELASVSGVGQKTSGRIDWAVKEALARYGKEIRENQARP